MASPGIYRFGTFELDGNAYRLMRNGVEVPLTPKALDVLLFLAGRAGSLVTKEALLEGCWPGVYVTENTLAQVISSLRDALGERGDRKQTIETVPRRGYRFMAALLAAERIDSGDARIGTRAPRAPTETASLAAYRAFTDGRLRLESLNPQEIRHAVDDFERAIASDPQYAYAFAGLASARFLLFEASRTAERPDVDLLNAALAHADRAIELAPDLAEAYASRSTILLAAGRSAEALAAAQRAVSLEPEHWRNHFRLGHAAWGETRLSALATALSLYPELAYARFEMAMVHIARAEPGRAVKALEEGVALQRSQRHRTSRFPADGLCWLLGLVRLAGRQPDAAAALFDEEIDHADEHRLYAREFAINARDGRGFAWLDRGSPERAVTEFEAAIDLAPHRVRSRLGRALALIRLGRAGDAGTETAMALDAISRLASDGRAYDAALLTAFAYAGSGREQDALTVLQQLLEQAPPGQAGWSIPIEPFLCPLRDRPQYSALLQRLSARAR